MSPLPGQPTEDLNVTQKINNLTLLDSPQQSGILRLPTELMNAILERVFVNCHVVIELYPGNMRPSCIRHKIPFGILIANRALRNLSLPFLRGLHVHAVDRDSWHLGPNDTPRRNVRLRNLPSILIENVGSLALDICRIESDIRGTLPNLKHLIVTGCRDIYDVHSMDTRDFDVQTVAERVEAIVNEAGLQNLLALRPRRSRRARPPGPNARQPLKISFEVLLYGVVTAPPPFMFFGPSLGPFLTDEQLRIKYDRDEGKIAMKRSNSKGPASRADLDSLAQWEIFSKGPARRGRRR